MTPDALVNILFPSDPPILETTMNTATNKPAALALRPALYDRKYPGFIVSVVGGPGDLLWRATEAAALADGAACVEAHWAQRPDGAWYAV